MFTGYLNKNANPAFKTIKGFEAFALAARATKFRTATMEKAAKSSDGKGKGSGGKGDGKGSKGKKGGKGEKTSKGGGKGGTAMGAMAGTQELDDTEAKFLAMN